MRKISFHCSREAKPQTLLAVLWDQAPWDGSVGSLGIVLTLTHTKYWQVYHGPACCVGLFDVKWSNKLMHKPPTIDVGENELKKEIVRIKAHGEELDPPCARGRLSHHVPTYTEQTAATAFICSQIVFASTTPVT